jgi:hypothetical protein
MQLNHCQSARTSLRLFLCFLTAATWAASAQSVKDETTDVAVLRSEVQRLALELLRHRAEFIQWKMHWMRAELQQVQAERQRLTGERQSIEREIGELNHASTNSPGGENEDRKEELNGVQVPALLAGERAATTRESVLTAALSAENAQISEIQKQMERLATQPKPKPK